MEDSSKLEDRKEPTDGAQTESPPESELKRNARLLESWYQNYYLWNSTFMLNCMMNKPNPVQPLFVPPSRPQPTTTFFFPTTEALINHLNQNRFANDAANQRGDAVRDQHSEANAHLRFYKIPSLYRRFFAELVDAFYIQIIKIIIAVALFNYTDMFDEETFSIIDFIEDMLNEDNINNVRVPVDLLLLELIYVLISIVFESYCLFKNGFTPGKYLLSLRVVSCTRVNDHMRNLVQISPGTRPSLKSIIMRTSLKNFSIIFLFPTIFFFLLPAFMEYGQTSYDKASESIVVQEIGNRAV